MTGDPQADLAFWGIVLAESKRTVICSAEVAERLRAAIAAHGLGHRLEVQVSAHLPTPSTVLVIDEQAIEAATRAEFQKTMRRGGWFRR